MSIEVLFKELNGNENEKVQNSVFLSLQVLHLSSNEYIIAVCSSKHIHIYIYILL